MENPKAWLDYSKLNLNSHVITHRLNKMQNLNGGMALLSI